MTCTICGHPFILGSDLHKHCREREKLSKERNKYLDQVIEWYKDSVDKYGSNFIERIMERLDED